jgi:hypothetical protein
MRYVLRWVYFGGLVLCATGRPGDRSLFLDVTGRIETASGKTVEGERVQVFPGQSYPCGRFGGVSTALDENDPVRCAEEYMSDPNGVFSFVAFNTEPVSVPLVIALDMVAAPSVEFVVVLPNREMDGYKVKMVYWVGEWSDKASYRRVERETGRITSKAYTDESGGLRIRKRGEAEGKQFGAPGIEMVITVPEP